ncbi:regulatory protein for RecA [Oleiphilus messinensis]|uniref:Regulatory protein RecX n=1 Tax=Oleiphilus messinensis TaxID=141451 RepID=A0A1Y0IAI7_9GAMM|nr:regulatory protein RecX [Oleiphilus messinensis]ARU57542.1 regulatory protein for RecA [Oleiphilus messinensis]
MPQALEQIDPNGETSGELDADAVSGLVMEIDAVLDKLEQDRYLNDARFSELFVRSAQSRGRGPVRVRYDLQERGVSAELISQFLDESDPSWFELAKTQLRRKFPDKPITPKDKAKQLRFLAQRGFTSEQAYQALSSGVDEL